MNSVHSAPSPLEVRSPRRTKFYEFLALLAVSVLVWGRPLAANFRLAISSDAYTYILLILPLGIALILVQYKPLRRTAESKRWIGAILLSIALLLRVSTASNLLHVTPVENLSVSLAALVVWWIGSVIFCFGLDVLRSLLFPLGFLFLIVPMPEDAVTWATGFLQQQSAWAAGILFRLAGVPVTREGINLSIPGLSIEVAHECSSIRSSTILIVVTLVLAHLFLRSGWRQTLLVLAAIPLSVVKNAIRIFTIAELATRVNPSFLHGSFHHHGGVVFLTLAVLMVVALLWILRKSEMRGVAELSLP